MRHRFTLAALLALLVPGALGPGCLYAEPAECRAGDRRGCQCASGEYGYQQCGPGGAFGGGCACDPALSPDAGPAPWDRCGIASNFNLSCDAATSAPGDGGVADGG